jgi:hypothetical protein
MWDENWMGDLSRKDCSPRHRPPRLLVRCATGTPYPKVAIRATCGAGGALATRSSARKGTPLGVHDPAIPAPPPAKYDEPRTRAVRDMIDICRLAKCAGADRGADGVESVNADRMLSRY